MNKLLMAVAIVCATVATQAASVDWKVSGTSADVGITVYLLTSIESTYNNVAAIEAAAIDSATVAKNGRVYNTGDKTTAGVTSDEMATSFFVIIAGDGKSFSYLEKDMSSFVYDPAQQQTSPGSFADFTVAGITAGSSGTIGGTPGPVVPEPTSGLLFLVGMAGLALRRKQK